MKEDSDDLPDKSRGTAAFERGLLLFDRIVRDEGRTPLSGLAPTMGLPESTARRLAGALERQGLVARVGRGRYAAGKKLAALGALADPHIVLARASRPLLRRLARQSKATVHLGILEAEMVTYLVKEYGGGVRIFTREGSQLEGYCTAIGKMLLASLDDAEREAYLGSAPFVALTDRTVTEPDEIRAMLARVRAQGFATEDGEIADGLRCLALPVTSSAGEVVAAISIARLGNARTPWPEPWDLDDARSCAEALSAIVG